MKPNKFPSQTPSGDLLKNQVENAVKVLQAGGVILYPTDTIWGLGCDATNREAVEKIYKIKQRQDSKSLIVLAANPDMVCKYVKEIPEIALSLMEVNDKPMTLIYPGAIGLASNVVAEDGSIGIRVPDHEFCRRLITRFRRPVVSTSANISGTPAPRTYEEIPEEIRRAADLIADPACEGETAHRASQIIKVGLQNEIEIIRE